MASRLFGYARVSAADQNLDRQLDTFSKLDLDEIVTDKASGKNFDRPGWRSLIRRLKPGDVLYVASIDRLGRNYDEILSVWQDLTHERGVDVVVLDMPLLDTRIPLVVSRVISCPILFCNYLHTLLKWSEIRFANAKPKALLLLGPVANIWGGLE